MSILISVSVLIHRYLMLVSVHSSAQPNKPWNHGGASSQLNSSVLCCRFSNHGSFQEILNEMNDYAGQRELIAENMMTSVCVELTKYLQDLKQERKSVSRWAPGGQWGEALLYNAVLSSFLSTSLTPRRPSRFWRATLNTSKV